MKWCDGKNRFIYKKFVRKISAINAGSFQRNDSVSLNKDFYYFRYFHFPTLESELPSLINVYGFSSWCFTHKIIRYLIATQTNSILKINILFPSQTYPTRCCVTRRTSRLISVTQLTTNGNWSKAYSQHQELVFLCAVEMTKESNITK